MRTKTRFSPLLLTSILPFLVASPSWEQMPGTIAQKGLDRETRRKEGAERIAPASSLPDLVLDHVASVDYVTPTPASSLVTQADFDQSGEVDA